MAKNEFDIIREFFAEPGLCFPRDDIVVGNGDDGAVLRAPAGQSIVLSTDVLNAGYHFPAYADPAAIANRALAVNLSDLAAMAAQPWCFTLGLTLPRFDDAWLGAFASGLKKPAQQYNCPLVGGDLNQGPLSIAIGIQGLIDGPPLLRSGARPGDTIYVSGCLGDAAALLCLDLPSHLGAEFQLIKPSLSKPQRDYLCQRYYYPLPRLELAVALRSFVNAAIDLSDGLVGDLGHILDGSKVAARIWIDRLPLSDAVIAAVGMANGRRAALFGGDDYELCFTASAEHHEQITAQAAAVGVAVTAVGEVTPGAGLQLIDSDGQIVNQSEHSFRHF